MNKLPNDRVSSDITRCHQFTQNNITSQYDIDVGTGKEVDAGEDGRENSGNRFSQSIFSEIVLNGIRKASLKLK